MERYHSHSWKVEKPKRHPHHWSHDFFWKWNYLGTRYHSFYWEPVLSHIWQIWCGELDVGKDSLHHGDIYIYVFIYIYIYYKAILSFLDLLMFCSSQVCSGCYLTFCTWRCVESLLKGPSYPTYTEDPYNSPFDRGNTSSIPSEPFMALMCLWSKLKPEPCGEKLLYALF